jgi:hypothetical protein
MREKAGLPPLFFFTTDWNRFDWFGWGDWLYLLTAVVACIQSFFMFDASITDDATAGYYLFGR